MDEDSRWLEWAERQFIAIAGEDQQIDLQEFKTALKVKRVCPIQLVEYTH